MSFTVNEDLSGYSAEDIGSLITEGNGLLDALFAIEDPSDEDVAEARRVSEIVASLEAERDGRVTAAAARAEEMSALRSRRVEASNDEPEADEAEDDEEDDEAEEEPEAVAPEPPAAVVEEPKVEAASVRKSARQTLARKAPRPAVPEKNMSHVTITAAADVPQFAAGSNLDDLDAVTAAVINRMKGFPSSPTGDPNGQMHHYGVAFLRKPFEEALVANGSNDQEVIDYVTSEARLTGKSLVAAGGWCAPSETIYDLCGEESLDGLVDLPEFTVRRGGIRTTRGPMFADLYNHSFWQTEAQAIAGTTKTCFTVSCPTFTDNRLDAVGICITAPILTNAAWPELVRRYVSGALVAHQHLISVTLLGKMQTAAGAAIVANGVGAVSANTLNALELVAESVRSDYRLSMSATMEVVLPYWIKAAIRADLGMRTGVDMLSVTDQQIVSYFAARKLRVQFVYGWQGLTTGQEGYPTTVNALIYPAGTFSKGTADVISLDAVYDAASLSTNTYTGLFFEEGILLHQNCYDAKLVTIPVCAGGITGAANNSSCFNLTP